MLPVKDKDAPKAPNNCYFIFKDLFRRDQALLTSIEAEVISGGFPKTHTLFKHKVNSEIDKVWKQMDDDAKEPFRDIAKLERDGYKEKMKQFKEEMARKAAEDLAA